MDVEPQVDRSQRWPVVVAPLATLFVVLLLASRLYVGHDSASRGTLRTTASMPDVPIVASSDPDPRRERVTQSARSASVPIVVPHVLGVDEAEFCGYGVVTKSQIGQAGIVDAVRLPEIEGNRRLAEALIQRDGEARALGTWLGLEAATASVRKQSADAEAACGANKVCADAVDTATARVVEAAAQPTLDQLATLALSTSDPGTYAIAMQACRSREGRCGMLSVEQWTHVDPTNAVPWLYAAAEARERHDDAGRLNALYHASIATASKQFGDGLLVVAEPSMGALSAEPERLLAGVTLTGMQAAWSLPSFRAVTETCSERELQDSNRRQLCDALATMLLERSGTLIERSIGARLAERIGWAPERLKDARLEADAFSSMPYAVGYIDSRTAYSCRTIKENLGRALEKSRLGEVAFTRAQLAASGLSTAELAAKTVARRESARTDAERRRVGVLASGAASSGP